VGDVDQPRFLHRNAAAGYTNSSALAARGEPEAVDEREQRRQTALAHRRERQHQQDVWRQARGLILDGIQTFTSSAAVDGRLAAEMRPIRRQVDRVSRELGV
jgi:hypothetical protein